MQTTITFANGDQVTSAKLNEIVSGLSFTNSDITGTTLVVTGGNLKVGTVTLSEMGALSVGTTQLVAECVTTGKLAEGAVTGLRIANLAVTGAKIATATITFSHFVTAIAATQSNMHAEASGYIVAPSAVKFAPGAAKAYGEFDIATSARAIKDGSVNISSLTRIDSTHTTVGLVTNMNSANYTVIATFVQASGTPVNDSVTVYEKLAGSFKLMHSSELAGRAVNFVIFGRYN